VNIAAGVALAVAALVAAPDATASTVEMSSTSGPQASEVVLYFAARGERNQVRVRYSQGNLSIVDRGVKRIRVLPGVFAECHARSRRHVVCEDAPVDMRLGDRDDRAAFPPGDGTDPPRTDAMALAEDPSYYANDDDEGAIHNEAFIDGGRGNDVIYGTAGDDVIYPGPGRDKVRARGGADAILLSPDGARDSIGTGSGIDSLNYASRRAVRVDLAAGTAGAAGEHDTVAGIERVHGGSKGDTLLGGPQSDALYGDGGGDHIDGRGGDDLVIGDAPDAKRPAANTLAGGPGDDLIDARGARLTPTNRVDCGAGEDVVAGEVDDLLAASCESAAFREPSAGDLVDEYPWDYPRIPAQPVAYAADGTPSFRMRCPDADKVRCKGTFTLTRPPAAGDGGKRELYGEGTFDLARGAEGEVPATLTDAGRAAIDAGQPVSVRVTSELYKSGPKPPPYPVDFGWQAVLVR
jgi:Ca2+-binding RTX toxin-like protein